MNIKLVNRRDVLKTRTEMDISNRQFLTNVINFHSILVSNYNLVFSFIYLIADEFFYGRHQLLLKYKAMFLEQYILDFGKYQTGNNYQKVSIIFAFVNKIIKIIFISHNMFVI